MNMRFSKEETAAIIKHLRLPTREKKKFIDKAGTLEVAALYKSLSEYQKK